MNSYGRRGGYSMLALAAVVLGVLLVLYALHAQQDAPDPVSAGSLHTPTPDSGRSNHHTTGPNGHKPSTSDANAEPQKVEKPLSASRPVSLTIPSIGVDTDVIALGKAEDGTLAVPQPGPNLNKAAWFQNSPTPGQPGPSIIEGHVDSEQGPSVFFKLGDIRPGDAIHVTRADGSHLTFVVNAVRDFAKASFPTELVYGGADITTPQLRLITCSDFSTAAGTHLGNEVVFAHLTQVTTSDHGPIPFQESP
jgi:sortase (surface protein transpeptidase)